MSSNVVGGIVLLFSALIVIVMLLVGMNRAETEVTKLDSDRGIYVVDSPKDYPYTCFVLKTEEAMECVKNETSVDRM